jgi:hypothetical protein
MGRWEESRWNALVCILCYSLLFCGYGRWQAGLWCLFRQAGAERKGLLLVIWLLCGLAARGSKIPSFDAGNSGPFIQFAFRGFVLRAVLKRRRCCCS